MTDKPYTDADVELAARAEYEHDMATAGGTARWGDTFAFVCDAYRDRARAGLDALAAAGRLADARHIVEIWSDGWTIQHPSSCRPDLLGCPVGQVVGPAMVPAPPGRYECSANDLGDRFLLGDRVDQAEG